MGSKDKKKRVNKNGYTVSEKALAQRRNNSGLIPARNDEEREYNARMIEHIMQINLIAEKADRHDLLSLKSCFVNYLQLCQSDGFKVGNLAAYASMGMGKDDFAVFAKKDNPEIRQFCKFVKETCAMFRETMVAENQLNPVIGIFWQRNFDGLRNDTEQVQAINEQQEEYSGSTGYKDKYRQMIGGGNK